MSSSTSSTFLFDNNKIDWDRLPADCRVVLQARVGKRRVHVRTRSRFLLYLPAPSRHAIKLALEGHLRGKTKSSQARCLSGLAQVTAAISRFGLADSIHDVGSEQALRAWAQKRFGAKKADARKSAVANWRDARKVLLLLMSRKLIPEYDLPPTNPHTSQRNAPEHNFTCNCSSPAGPVVHSMSVLRLLPKEHRAPFLASTKKHVSGKSYGQQRRTIRGATDLITGLAQVSTLTVFDSEASANIGRWLRTHLACKDSKNRSNRLEDWRAARLLLLTLAKDQVIDTFPIPPSDPSRRDRLIAKGQSKPARTAAGAKAAHSKIVRLVQYPVEMLVGARGKPHTYSVPLLRLIPKDRRSSFSKALALSLDGRSESDQRRSLRTLSSLAIWLRRQDSTIDITNIPSSDLVRRWLRQYLIHPSKASFLTKHTDWMVLRALLLRLMSQRAITSVRMLPPVSGKALRLQKLVRSKKTVLDKLILTDHERRVLQAPEIANDAFFETIARKCDVLYRAIRAQALTELRVAAADLAHGEDLARRCNIDRLRSLMNAGISVDPEIELGRGRNHPSLFSTSHPDGLSNLVGWVVHEEHSVLYDRQFTGASWSNDYYRQDGGLDRLRRHFALTLDVAAAAFSFLVLDRGFNVESLQNAHVKDPVTGTILLAPTDDQDVWRITLPKPRAQKEIGGLATVAQDMGAVEVLQFVHRLTDPWRKTFGLEELWLHHGDRRNARITLMSATAFKGGHRRFMDRIPGLDKLVSGHVSRADIRVLSGICKWFETGGDMVKTAKHLHNSPAVAIKNYIPAPLREAFYAFQIRKFQTLTIMAATTKDRGLAKRALRFGSMEQVNRAFDSMLANKALAQSSLIKAATKATSAATPVRERLTVLLSARNVAVMKRLSDVAQSLRNDRPDIDIEALQARGRSLPYWLDLWAVIKHKMSNDDYRYRALTSIWKDGLALSDDPSFTVAFPFIEQFLERTA